MPSVYSRTVFVIGIVQLIESIAFSLPLSYFPSYALGLGASVAFIGVFTSSFMLASAIMSPKMGAFSDTTHGSLTVQLTGLGQVVTAVELKFPEEQPKTIRNSLGMIFSYIPPGSFTMGSLGTEPGREGDEVPHEVTLTKGFYLQTTEVTQRQWKAIMGANPSYFSRCGDSCPVETVTWEDVHAFIDQLNARGEGTYRLPTEAEWEYAARAGSTTAFANGVISELECGVDPNLNAMGWYCGNAANTTHPVAQKESNGWGLYDMHGNVWEWCEDWYADYPAGSVTDPTGPSEGSYRVVRGGSGFFNAEYCRSAGRYFLTPEALGIDLGLRLVRVAP